MCVCIYIYVYGCEGVHCALLNTAHQQVAGVYALHAATRHTVHTSAQSILVDGKPHIGTDRLVRLLREFRAALGGLGVNVRFGSCVEELCVQGGRITGVRLQGVCVCGGGVWVGGLRGCWVPSGAHMCECALHACANVACVSRRVDHNDRH